MVFKRTSRILRYALLVSFLFLTCIPGYAEVADKVIVVINEEVNQMEYPETGGYAFPGKINVDGQLFYVEGMTLRDYFAGQVLAGNLGSAEGAEFVAQLAYGRADAMLKERKKKE